MRERGKALVANIKRLRINENWQRNLAVMSVAELVAVLGFTVFMPFLPYYVQDLGVTEPNAVKFWSGLVITAQAVTMAIFAPLWGSLADRYGRKIMVERAMFGGAVVIGLMGFTHNVYQLAGLRMVQGALTGTIAAATTLVVSGTPSERRGYALGILQMAIYLGASVGPMLGGLVADQFGYRATFWVTGALLGISGVAVLLLVREEFVSPEVHEKGRTRLWAGIVMVLRTRALMVVFGVRVLTRIGMRTVTPMLPLFVQEIAPVGTKVASLTGIIEGGAAATSAVAAVVLGRFSDRIGYRRILLGCSAAAVVIYFLLARVNFPYQLLILRVLGGVTMGGTLTAVSAMQAALAPKGRFGAVYGLDTTMVSIANAVAPLIGATVAASFGLSAVFVAVAIIYVATTAVVAVVVPGKPRVS